ncbi:LacI family transcriptional regulator [Marinococcus halophilus]|uniref:Catabolite control protein A n=1 Tax=Marinococcus halophilus TaxID=1371 RepID=A0A510Y9U6_MARHA|nr:substrate-binding domain-containing protein [Marinococcus halophilus]OZT78857.1 LacI family transcriptional regulator [Marinococcus halophilus]GEK60166.1 catabolite control protein A [Marinococcus halophilus]
MRKNVTLRDVAKEANVSISTVSQFMNGRFTYMGEETKGRIEQAIAQLNYRPNAIARGLKQQKTTTIGVIIANVVHRFSTLVVRAIEDMCIKYNYHVIICNADDDETKEKQYIDMLMAKQIDGMIIIPSSQDRKNYEDILSYQIPLVFLDRTVEQSEAPSVVVNNYKASYEAVRHLIDRGYRNIGFIGPELKMNTRKERFRGFEEALRTAGIAENEKLMYHGEVNGAQKALSAMLSRQQKPDALFISNDRMLVEALTFAKTYALNIPEDLALVTFDEVEYASFFSPSLTTIEQPAYQMGEEAAELLLKQVNDGVPAEELSREYVHRTTFHVRDSTEIKA